MGRPRQRDLRQRGTVTLPSRHVLSSSRAQRATRRADARTDIRRSCSGESRPRWGKSPCAGVPTVNRLGVCGRAGSAIFRPLPGFLPNLRRDPRSVFPDSSKPVPESALPGISYVIGHADCILDEFARTHRSNRGTPGDWLPCSIPVVFQLSAAPGRRGTADINWLKVAAQIGERSHQGFPNGTVLRKPSAQPTGTECARRLAESKQQEQE